MKDPLDYTLKLLSYRDRSKNEIRARLVRRGYAEETVESTVRRLEELGYLDDIRIAKNLIEYWCKEKPMGRERLLFELTKRLFPEETSKQLIEAAFRDVPEVELAKRCLAQYLKRTALSGKPDQILARIERFLVQRGFSRSSIREALAAAELPARVRGYLDT